MTMQDDALFFTPTIDDYDLTDTLDLDFEDRGEVPHINDVTNVWDDGKAVVKKMDFFDFR